MSRRLFSKTKKQPSDKPRLGNRNSGPNQLMREQKRITEINKTSGSFKPKANQINRANRKLEESRIMQWKSNVLADYIIPPGMVHKILAAINTEKGGFLEFFFMDGKEIYDNRQFSLMLFGKIRTRNGELEAKVLIRDPKRHMFVFPRRDEKIEDVKEEIKRALGRETAGKVSFKVVKKKYCFEINLEYR